MLLQVLKNDNLCKTSNIYWILKAIEKASRNEKKSRRDFILSFILCTAHWLVCTIVLKQHPPRQNVDSLGWLCVGVLLSLSLSLSNSSHWDDSLFARSPTTETVKFFIINIDFFFILFPLLLCCCLPCLCVSFLLLVHSYASTEFWILN